MYQCFLYQRLLCIYVMFQQVLGTNVFVSAIVMYLQGVFLLVPPKELKIAKSLTKKGKRGQLSLFVMDFAIFNTSQKTTLYVMYLRSQCCVGGSKQRVPISPEQEDIARPFKCFTMMWW